MKRTVLKGFCGQLYIVELWTLLCWLIPIAMELTVRRFVALPAEGESILLLGGYLINRLLVAPIHVGYNACCRKLAFHALGDAAATCEIGDLRQVRADATLLKTFFGAYKRPVYALKQQLRWDVLRALCYTVTAFPGVLLVALGGMQGDVSLQALFAGCGMLLTAGAWLLLWVVLRRLQTALLLDIGFLDALKRTRKKTGALLEGYVRMLPLLLVPFSLQRFVLHVRSVALLQQRCSRSVKKRHSQIFHTRVLGET